MTDGKTARNHVSHIGLAIMWGLSRSDVAQIINLSPLKSIAPTNILRDMIFNYQDLIQKFRVCETHPTTWIVLQKDAKILKCHLCDFGIIIAACIAGDINGCFSSIFPIANIYVEPNSLQNFIVQHLEKICHEPLTKQHAAKVLDISSDEIEQLIKNEEFHWAAWSRGEPKIDGHSFFKFWKSKYAPNIEHKF